MSPSLAPPAGGFKCRDDEYWNKHGGLMTSSWSHKIESQERLKNAPMSINLRSRSAGLPAMTLRPTSRPRTVPADLSKEQVAGRRFLSQFGDNDSAPATPGRRVRSNSTADLRRNFADNMFVFNAGMGKAEPLSFKEFVAAGAGLTPPGSASNARRQMMLDGTSAPIMNSRSGCATPTQSPMNAMSPAPFTCNQMYGARVHEGEAPPNSHINGRKTKTVSSVVMGM